jgi:hypothetical protein
MPAIRQEAHVATKTAPVIFQLARFIQGLLRDQMMGGDHRADPA